MRTALFVSALAFNLGILMYFKYANFFITNVNTLFNRSIELAEIALPIGISFYTFQIMSYIIDVYKKNVKAQYNILNLALYISFFPQLIAGPIVRYIDIEKQINERTVSIDKTYEGIKRFMIGFAKKVLIADQLNSLVAIAFDSENLSAPMAWIGIIAYTLQIYYDFSGYSDMAIGLGKIFGFDFMENFDHPYVSKSIQEFWRRWHISLSTWFRDYVYIPLGGSYCSKSRLYFNILVVFFLTGFWHGASWNFIFWGLYYAVFLIIERAGFGRVLKKWPKFLQHFYAIIVVMIGWVFFRADGFMNGLRYLKSMFTWNDTAVMDVIINMNLQYVTCIIAGIIFSRSYNLKVLKNDYVIILLFFVAICYMVGSGFSPFLYFRF